MNKKNVVYSLIVYLFGTLFLLCADFFVSRNFDQIFVANWAAIKSIIFVFGGICVFGFDQILMRQPEIASKVLKIYILQVLSISLIFSYILTTFFIPDLDLFFIFLIIALYAFNQFWAATFRGNNQLVAAQIFTNGWKISLFVLLLLGILNQYYIYSLSFIIVLLINSLLIFNFLKLNIKSSKLYYEHKNLYKMSSFFLLNNVSVTIATYGEQLLINSFGDKYLSYIIFNYVLAFNSLMLLFAGFLGFYYGPKLKSITTMTVEVYYKYIYSFILFSLVLSIISFSIGWLIFKYYLLKDFDIVVAIACLSVGMIKVLYTIPSASVALYCNLKEIRRISIFNIFNMIGFIVIFYILMMYKVQNLSLYIFLIILLHWSLRFINTHKVILSSLRRLNENS